MMKVRKDVMLGVCGLVAGLMISVPMVYGAKLGEKYTEMGSAKNSLQEARKHLNAANSDFGGHRSAALKLVDSAISEIDAGMQGGK